MIARKKIPIFLYVMFMVLVFVIGTPICHADELSADAKECKDTIENIQDKGGISKVALNEFLDIYQHNTSAYVGGTLETIGDSLKTMFSDGSGLSNIYDVLTIFAKTLLLLFFMLKLVETSLDMKLTVEIVAKISIQYMIALIFINNGFTWIKYIMEATLGLVKALGFKCYMNGDDLPYESVDFQNVIKEIDGNNFLGNLGVVVRYSSFGLIPLICVAIVGTTLWGIIVEIGVRTCFASIAFSEMAYSGFGGSGFRYFKKMIGYILGFVSIFISAYICDTLYATIKTGMGSSDVWSVLCINVITVYIITKATSYTHDIFA